MAAATKGAPECPVFRPTLAEVHGSSFVEYVEKLERSKAFREAGICKIVAPEGWSPRRQGYNRLNFDLPRPIRQHATGRQGLYRTLMVEAKKMRLDEFRDMAREALNAAPKDAARGGAGERGEGPTVAEREAWAEELERQFWRNVTLNPPLYGADIPGSLFDPGLKGWSLRRLRSLLSDTLEAHSIRMPGVNEPYLYIGSWRSLFAWHTEDMDLHSVNYLHCGASKQWYVVPPAHRQRFELLMRSLLQDLFRACPEFMRHKELLVSPQLLASHAIPVVRVVHNPREFVVVYPGAYHSGFNHGFNIAESVNFATKAWLPIGAAAGYCECTSDSARIDMRLFRDHMPSKLRREVENMYASSDDEEEDECGETDSSDNDVGSAEESVGSEAEEEASSSDVEEQDDGDEEDEAPRKRQRQQRRARRRQPAGALRRKGKLAGGEEDQAEEGVESTSDWEPEDEAQRPEKRARGIGAAAAPAPTAPPLAKPGSPRPQRSRRPPSRDLDMVPVRQRPPSGGAGAAAQPDGQRSGGAAAPPNPAAAAASRKRSLARSQQAKAGAPSAPGAAAKQSTAVVGTSSRGRPLKLKLLSSLVSLLPLSQRK